MTDHTDSLETDLGRVLRAVKVTPIEGPPKLQGPDMYAPAPDHIKDAPENGVTAYRNIMTYAEHYAKYLEDLGEAMLSEAEDFKDRCAQLASDIRLRATREADRAVAFTRRINGLAKSLDDAHKLTQSEDL